MADSKVEGDKEGRMSVTGGGISCLADVDQERTATTRPAESEVSPYRSRASQLPLLCRRLLVDPPAR